MSAGDAATTAANVVANSGLVRVGVVADLFQATVCVFLGMTLYLLLKHVHKSAASAMVVLVAIGTGIMCLNAVFEFEGLRVATGAVNLAAFGTAGSNALVLLLLDTQHYGYPHRADLLWPVAGAAGVSRLQYQGGSPRRWASCSSWGASATSWTCSRCSWSPTSAKRSTPSSPSRQQSRRSGWSSTCL